MSSAKKTVKKVKPVPKIDPKDEMIEKLSNENYALRLGMVKVAEENKTINLMWIQDLKCLITKLGGQVYIDPVTAQVGNDELMTVVQNYDQKGGRHYTLVMEKQVEE